MLVCFDFGLPRFSCIDASRNSFSWFSDFIYELRIYSRIHCNRTCRREHSYVPLGSGLKFITALTPESQTFLMLGV